MASLKLCLAVVVELSCCSGIAAAGDATTGATIFENRCSECHSPERGVNKNGPSLAGVYGRASASLPGYSYSSAMKGAGKHWDQASLEVYLRNPRATVPGTRMSFRGFSDPQKIEDVIAYLQTLK